jgi:oligoribonuclease (3'-5' exoribonuclease)
MTLKKEKKCIGVMEKYIDARFDGLEKENAITSEHLNRYYDAQLKSIREAITLASRVTDERLARMNEFRDAMQDQQNRYLTMSEHDVWKDKIESEMNTFRDFKTEIAAKASQRGLTWGYIIIGINLFISISALILAYGDKLLGN